VLEGSTPLEPFLILGSWTPNLAAFLVLALVLHRRGGIRELFAGWTRWRTTPAWYLVAVSPLLIGLLIVAIVLASRQRLSSQAERQRELLRQLLA
jgi:hypothetical protein